MAQVIADSAMNSGSTCAQTTEPMSRETAPEPVYLAIRRSITERIERGEYASGCALPSEHELAEEFGVARLTIRKAIDDLVARGTIRRIQGKGAYVTMRLPMHGELLSGFREVARSQYANPSVRLLATGKRMAGPYYARLFGIDPDDELYTIRRLNSVNDMPFSIENTFIPLRLFPGIEEVDISVFSLYETYASFGHKVALAQEKLGIESLSARDAGLLQVKAGSPALVLESLSYDEDRRVIEYARSLNSGKQGGYTYQY